MRPLINLGWSVAGRTGQRTGLLWGINCIYSVVKMPDRSRNRQTPTTKHNIIIIITIIIMIILIIIIKIF